MPNYKRLEQVVESSLWSVRFVTILPVFFGICSVFTLFAMGSSEILHGIRESFLGNDERKAMMTIGNIIGGIDLYLIGIVLLIFSFGIYELFISKIDIGRLPDREIKILEISSLDQLKEKILKVVVVALVVSFFKHALTMEIKTALDILYLAVAILLVAVSSYLMQIHPPHRSLHSSDRSSEHSSH